MRFILIALALIASTVAQAADTNLVSRLVMQTAHGTIPTCASASGDGDICVGDDLQTVGEVIVGSTLTANGGITLGGAVAGAGQTITGHLSTWTDKTSNYTVAVTDCGTVLATDDDNRVFTLPAVAAANKGCIVTIVNFAADGGALMSISPNSADGIYGGCTGAGPAYYHFSGTDDKDAQNTKATQDKGDFMTLVSDGSTGWFVIACTGIWASEA